jgi:hypothetical protein
MIKDADTINDDEYKQLIHSQKICKITKVDKLKIEKYIYIKKLGDISYIDKFYNKLYVLDNFNNLIWMTKHDDGYFNKTKHYNDKLIIKIIESLGMKPFDTKTKIYKDTFDKNINDAMKYVYTYNKNNLQNKDVFYDNIKQKMGIINTILHEYGMKIKTCFTYDKNKVKIYYYSFDYVNDINKIISKKLYRKMNTIMLNLVMDFNEYDINNIGISKYVDKYVLLNDITKDALLEQLKNSE